MATPTGGPRRLSMKADAALILGTEDASLLDIVDNVLNKGVVLTGDITIALADVDLLYARLSLLLCAADRVLPTESHDAVVRRSRRRAVRARLNRIRGTLLAAGGLLSRITITTRRPQIANRKMNHKSQIKSQITNHKSQMKWCVYALTSPSGQRIAVAGIGGERLRPITVGRITALVGALARPPRVTEAALRRYSLVLQSLSEQLPSLLPARFGTSVEDLIELTFILQSRQQAFRRNLQDVRGRVQMTVRVVEPRRPPAVPRPKTNAAGVESGAEYLRTRAADAARARDISGFAPLRGAVRRWIRDERVERRGPVASVYHLVPRGQAEKYRQALERAARDAGQPVIVSGPWPPYAFSTPF
jgi:hypothetical protein